MHRSVAILVSIVLIGTAAHAQQPVWSVCSDTTGGRACGVRARTTRREREEAQALYNAPATRRETGPYSLAPDSSIRGSLAIIGGPVRIAGTIDGSLLVINGDVQFAPTATVTGDVAILGGQVTGADSARLGALRVEREEVRFALDDGVLLLDAPYDEVFGSSVLASPRQASDSVWR